MTFGRKGVDEASIATAVAVRATLRAFAGLYRLKDGEGPTFSRSDIEHMMVAVLRVVIVHWISCTYGGVQAGRIERGRQWLRELIIMFDEREPYFYDENIISSDYAVAARTQNITAARRVMGLASGIAGEAIGDRSASELSSEAQFDTFSIFGPESYVQRKRWAELLEQSVADDLEIAARLGTRNLMLSPLWLDPAGDAMEVHLGEAHWSDLISGHWLHRDVIAFLRERRGGKLVLGNSPDEMAERMRAIAHLPDRFWENRRSKDVTENLAYCLNGDMKNSVWARFSLP